MRSNQQAVKVPLLNRSTPAKNRLDLWKTTSGSRPLMAVSTMFRHKMAAIMNSQFRCKMAVTVSQPSPQDGSYKSTSQDGGYKFTVPSPDGGNIFTVPSPDGGYKFTAPSQDGSYKFTVPSPDGSQALHSLDSSQAVMRNGERRSSVSQGVSEGFMRMSVSQGVWSERKARFVQRRQSECV